MGTAPTSGTARATAARAIFTAAALLASLLAPLSAADAQSEAEIIHHGQGPTDTIRVVNADGVEFNHTADRPRLSGNGRFLVYDSRASNVIPGYNDTNSSRDIFVYDRETGLNELISVGLNGEPADGPSTLAGISWSGRYVVFTSSASNLVADDLTNGDVFRYDRQTSTMEKVSVSMTGGIANGFSTRPESSADGRWIAFNSSANNLVAEDTNARKDVFVRDMENGVTYLVSKSSTGVQGNAHSLRPEISGDGSTIAFVSDATTLSSLDGNGLRDVYVHHRLTGETELVSVTELGTFARGKASRPSVSRDGRWVSFKTTAWNMYDGDTNGTIDAYVRDLHNDVTIPISVDKDGGFSRGTSDRPVMSGDGRWVAFNSSNNNLIADDSGNTDVFLRNMVTRSTYRVSLNTTGGSPQGFSYRPEISDDASVIVYRSSATDIVDDDTNGVYDLFITTLAAPTMQDIPTCVAETDGVRSSWFQARNRGLGSLTYEARLTWPGDEGEWVATDSFNEAVFSDLDPDVEYQVEVVAHNANGTSDSATSEPCSPMITQLCDDLVVTIDMNIAGTTGEGTPDADVILGTDGDDVINGGGGNDVICGQGGADSIRGGDGDDTIWGDTQADQIWGDEGNDTIHGGEGWDTLDGSGGDDVVSGGEGNDVIFGGFGDDQLNGGEGNDLLLGFSGADTIDGGAGNDRANGQLGDDTIDGGDDSDRLWGALGDDTIDGGPGWDLLVGGWGDDTLSGGDGNDTLFGEGDDDVLRGGTGNDQLNGGWADDLLDGGAGNDTCDGETGIDEAVDCEVVRST